MSLQLMAVFCEDIREEATGQQTLIGILPDIINLPPRPAEAKQTSRPRLPKLGVYFRIQMGVDEPAQPINVKLIFSDGQEVALGTIDQPLIDKAKQEARDASMPQAGLRFTAVYPNFRIESFGIMSAVCEMGNDRHTAGMLNFRILAQASGSPVSTPPS